MLIGLAAALAGALAGSARAERESARAALDDADRARSEREGAEAKAACASDASDAEARTRALEQKLAAAQATGIFEELEDAREAQRLGVARALGPPGALLSADDRRRLLASIVRAGRRYQLDPLLLAAVIHVESRFNPYAVSSVGARGLMQLMPATAGSLHGAERPFDARVLFNAQLNVELGAAYLRELIDRFDGDLPRALVAYNAGPGVARKLARGARGSPRLSVYPRAVLAERERLASLRDDGRTLAGL